MKWKTIVASGACALVSLTQAGQLTVGQVVPLSGLDANQGRAYSAGEYRAILLAANLTPEPAIATLIHCGLLAGRK